jgi:hypothetical protein
MTPREVLRCAKEARATKSAFAQVNSSWPRRGRFPMVVDISVTTLEIRRIEDIVLSLWRTTR